MPVRGFRATRVVTRSVPSEPNRYHVMRRMPLTLDIADDRISQSFGAARGARVGVAYDLGSTNQPFMDALSLIVFQDAMVTNKKPDIVGLRFYGCTADPPAAMLELSTALGMARMPTTSQANLKDFWIAVFSKLDAADATIPASAVKGSSSFNLWAKSLSAAAGASQEAAFVAHVTAGLTAVIGDMTNADASAYTEAKIWEQMYASYAVSLNMDVDFRIDHQYAKNHPKDFLAATVINATKARQMSWRAVMPQLQAPPGHVSGTAMVCNVSQDAQQQAAFWGASRGLMKDVLLPFLRQDVSAGGSDAGDMSGATASISAQASAIIAATPVSVAMQSKIYEGTVSDAKAFRALISNPTTVEWFNSTIQAYSGSENTETEILISIQCFEDLQKFMVGNGLDLSTVATPAGKSFASARASLEHLVSDMCRQLSSDRLMKTGKDRG